MNENLNEEQYNRICMVCDQLLQGNNVSITRVAIQWLHIISEHPVNINQYKDIFHKARSRWRKTVWQMCSFFWKLRPTFHKKEIQVEKNLPNSIDVLFISHILNKSQIGNEKDFYFGLVPMELKLRDVKVLVALRDHSGENLINIKQKWEENNVPRIILSHKIGWIEELSMAFQLIKEAIKLYKISNESLTDLQRNVCKKAGMHAISSSSLSTLRLYKQIQKIVKDLCPSSIVVTYEGHAWERIAFAAARSVNHKIKCVGYQHAIILPRQHAIRRSLGEK